MKYIKRFTPKSEVDNIIGQAKFQIGDRPTFYYGNGIVVAYATCRFTVENGEKIEYGENGLYALAILHFSDIIMLKQYFGLDYFEAKDIIRKNDVVIDGEITYDTTFQELHSMALAQKIDKKYREGETQRLIDGKMKVVDLFIMYGQYTFFFVGESKETKMSGFKYELCE